ncbi:TetR family transcriptional regulator [Achromobacter sp. 2789STDY5608615]|uniref:TetR family transcriptional regulator n=1 Tax=Achromobacter sp. 2789STDY5608615 TaxID=1806492 RepID=UPI003514F232
MTTALPPSVPQERRLTKGERTRLQLLEVAAAEFAERGFQHTRISDIVARAGVTQPVFTSTSPASRRPTTNWWACSRSACGRRFARRGCPTTRICRSRCECAAA